MLLKLQGGLGNQMFQYALGLALSKKHNCALLVDRCFYKPGNHNLTKRNYELDIFGIAANTANEKIIKRFLHPRLFIRIFNKIRTKPTLFREQSLKFNRHMFEITPPAYIEGFWQSEKYFKNDEALIRATFTFKKPLNSGSKNIVDQMATQLNTVSVHIRRGDYVSSKTTGELHGTCSVQYYKNAIDLMTDKLKSPHFYFFSDDAQWVNNNLASINKNYTLVQHNTGPDSWQDMALMSKCKHHIIANSSFSWWGAWLNPDKGKIVIAPQNWFNTTTDYFDDSDIVPNGWTRLPN